MKERTGSCDGTDTRPKTTRWNRRGPFEVTLSPDIDGESPNVQQPQTRNQANNDGNAVSNVPKKIERCALKAQMLVREAATGGLNER